MESVEKDSPQPDATMAETEDLPAVEAGDAAQDDGGAAEAVPEQDEDLTEETLAELPDVVEVPAAAPPAEEQPAVPPAAEVELAGVATAEATNRIKQLEVENHNKDLRIEELTQYLKEMEEAARRDHRKYEKEIKFKEADVTQIQSELKNTMIKIEPIRAKDRRTWSNESE